MKIYLGLAVIACLLTGCTVDNPSVPVQPESEEQDDPGERGGAETFDVNVECWKYLNKKWVKDKVSLKFEFTDTKNFEVGVKQMQGTGGNYVQVDIPEKVKYNKRDYKVTSILPRAFKKCKELDGIFIPASVRKIGDCGMTTVEIPSSVWEINIWAFDCCYDLTKAIIHGSPTIFSGAFPNNTELVYAE